MKKEGNIIENKNENDSGFSTLMRDINTGSSRKNELMDSLPLDIQNKLKNLGQRMSPEQRKEMIVSVCSIHPYSCSDIALLFGNTRQWAKKSCKELVSSGVLSMTIPEKPNSKNQA